MVANGITNGQTNKNNKGRKLNYCPHCDKKGLYKISRSYERCRYCGIYRLLIPGQDF